jgi:hypothetical protein
MYRIKPYTLKKARKLGVKVEPSSRPGKKIDVYSKTGEYITSVGARGYYDYPTYLEYHGRAVAEDRRKMYKKRHAEDRKVKGSRGWYADQLLW